MVPVALDEAESGALYASFAGYGTYSYAYGGWQGLTNLTASHLAGVGYGDVYAAFPGYGTWHDSYGNWSQVSTNTASAISATSNGWLFAAMPDGTWVLTFRGWEEITADTASRLTAASVIPPTGAEHVYLYADYSNATNGNGLFKYDSISRNGELTFSWSPVVTQVTGFQATAVSAAYDYAGGIAGIAGLPALGTYRVSGSNLYGISSLTPTLVAG